MDRLHSLAHDHTYLRRAGYEAFVAFIPPNFVATRGMLWWARQHKGWPHGLTYEVIEELCSMGIIEPKERGGEPGYRRTSHGELLVAAERLTTNFRSFLFTMQDDPGVAALLDRPDAELFERMIDGLTAKSAEELSIPKVVGEPYKPLPNTEVFESMAEVAAEMLPPLDEILKANAPKEGR